MFFFVFKQKTAYEMRISDWSSDVCSSDLLDDDFELVQDTFRRFADDKLAPIAEHIHRHNDDIPEEIISGLAEMGAFGLSIPEEYGGYGSGGDRKSTRLNSSHYCAPRMPSSA